MSLNMKVRERFLPMIASGQIGVRNGCFQNNLGFQRAGASFLSMAASGGIAMRA